MVLRALPYPHYGNGDEGTGMAGMGTGSQDRKGRGFSFSAVRPWSVVRLAARKGRAVFFLLQIMLCTSLVW